LWVTLKPSPLAFILFLFAGWISRQQLIVIEYLKTENRMLRERLNGRSLRLSDKERALLARKAPSAFHARFCWDWARLSRRIRCCAGTGN
jgi:hypothetical protein